MSEERKIRDALDAEAAVRRKLEAQYGDNLSEFLVMKSWYACSGTREFWDVEGILRLKKGKANLLEGNLNILFFQEAFPLEPFEYGF